jgi:hypothetical protein
LTTRWVLHQEVLRTRQRVLGPQHPDTLASMYNIALTAASFPAGAGKEADTEFMIAEAASGFARLFGEDSEPARRA